MFEWLMLQDEWDDHDESMHSDIERAFWLCYMDLYAIKLEQFCLQWGGCDPEICLSVLSEGDEDDRCVAICVIGWSYMPHACAALLPCLASPFPRERWCSALCLSEMGDERAVSVLCTMLTEFLPHKGNSWPQGNMQWWYEDRRQFLPLALRKWTQPEVIPALRYALHQQIYAEVYTYFNSSYCLFYEDYLAYELGLRQDFEVVRSASWSLAHLRRAVLLLILGFYDAVHDPCHWERTGSYDDDRVYDPVLRPTLIHLVTLTLKWPEQTASDCFDHAYEDYLLREREALCDEVGSRKNVASTEEF